MKPILKTTKSKVLLLTAIAITAVTVFGEAFQRTIPDIFKSPRAGTPEASSDSIKVYNEQMLKEFELVSRQLDGSRGPVSFSGTLYIQDKGDTLDTPQTIPFKLSRKGNELYYQLGRVEMLNSAGYYVYTDHDAKRIAVSEPKILFGNSFIDSRKMRDAFLSEDYDLKSSSQGSRTTISLINESHITCKEYTITFEKPSYLPTRFFIRLSNINDPLRTDNEKIIDIRITEKEIHPDVAKYLDKLTPVIKSEEGWKLKAGYSQYELITL